jgi:hypothetical protein
MVEFFTDFPLMTTVMTVTYKITIT